MLFCLRCIRCRSAPSVLLCLDSEVSAQYPPGVGAYLIVEVPYSLPNSGNSSGIAKLPQCFYGHNNYSLIFGGLNCMDQRLYSQFANIHQRSQCAFAGGGTGIQSLDQQIDAIIPP